MLELARFPLNERSPRFTRRTVTGGYRWSAFVLADGMNADLIGGALVGVLAGSRTKDHPFNKFALLGVGAGAVAGHRTSARPRRRGGTHSLSVESVRGAASSRGRTARGATPAQRLPRKDLQST